MRRALSSTQTALPRVPNRHGFVKSYHSGDLGKNGYNESFNGKLRDEFLNGEIFYTLPEAVVLVEQWETDVQYGPPPQRLRRPTPGSRDDKTIRLVP